MKRFGFFVPLLYAFASTGCSLPLDSLGAAPSNACTSDSECGTSGVCVKPSFADAKMCVATETNLDGVILEVRPAADATGSTVSHVFLGSLDELGQATDPRGVVVRADLPIPTNVTFSGQLFASESDTCTGTDMSLPARVELHSVSQFPALSATYKGSTDLKNAGMESYGYALAVPVGAYDVYTAPAPFDGCEAAVPPRLLSNVEVGSDAKLTPPDDDFVHLSGTLKVPDADAVNGWKLELVDPEYGLAVSDTATLGSADASDGKVHIRRKSDDANDPGLRYYYKSSLLIRLRNPQGKLVVHWVLDTPDPDMPVSLDLSQLVASPIHVHASVIASDAKLSPVPSSVRFQSTGLTGSTVQNARFRVDVDTDTGGEFDADLVAGTYEVTITPGAQDGPSAPLVDHWDLTGPQMGNNRAFQLPERPVMRGNVTAPNGTALSQVSVATSPTSATTSYVSTALALDFDASGSKLRESSSKTDVDGAFSMLVDPGTADFSIEPEATTGFPWLVIPSLLVSDAAVKPIDDRGELSLAAPVLVWGQVSSAKSAVQSAVVRAWLPVAPDEADGSSTQLVQIGEAVTDASGQFVLPLPPSIAFGSPRIH